MAEKVFELGDSVGAGSSMKAVNQMLVGIHIAAMAEAMTFGMTQGVEPDQFLEVISQCAGTSWALESRGPHVCDGDYTPLSAVDICPRIWALSWTLPSRRSLARRSRRRPCNSGWRRQARVWAARMTRRVAKVLRPQRRDHPAGGRMSTILGAIADDFTGATDLAGLLGAQRARVSLRIGVPEGPVQDAAPFEVIALKIRTAPVADAVAQARAAQAWLAQAGQSGFSGNIARPLTARHRATSAPWPRR